MKVLRGKPETEGRLLTEAFLREMSFKILEHNICREKDPEVKRVRRWTMLTLEEMSS